MSVISGSIPSGTGLGCSAGTGLPGNLGGIAGTVGWGRKGGLGPAGGVGSVGGGVGSPVAGGASSPPALGTGFHSMPRLLANADTFSGVVPAISGSMPPNKDRNSGDGPLARASAMAAATRSATLGSTLNGSRGRPSSVPG